MIHYKSGDIVVIPFPFVDKDISKPRPALVLSSRHDFTTLAMITTALWWILPDDTQINDLDLAGLPSTSYVRMKIFTLDTDIIKKKIGILSSSDRKEVIDIFQSIFSYWIH